MIYTPPTTKPFDQPSPSISKGRKSLMLYIRTQYDHYPLPLPDDETRYVFGRHDPQRPHAINVDLSPFDALELGVSRLHAAIDVSGVPTLTDLDSINGTYLNGERLLPYEICRLYNGDIICFGMFVLYVSFE